MNKERQQEIAALVKQGKSAKEAYEATKKKPVKKTAKKAKTKS